MEQLYGTMHDIDMLAFKGQPMGVFPRGELILTSNESIIFFFNINLTNKSFKCTGVSKENLNKVHLY